MSDPLANPTTSGSTNMWITGPAINVVIQTPSGERIGMYVSDPDTKALLDLARSEITKLQSQLNDANTKLAAREQGK